MRVRSQCFGRVKRRSPHPFPGPPGEQAARRTAELQARLRHLENDRASTGREAAIAARRAEEARERARHAALLAAKSFEDSAGVHEPVAQVFEQGSLTPRIMRPPRPIPGIRQTIVSSRNYHASVPRPDKALPRACARVPATSDQTVEAVIRRRPGAEQLVAFLDLIRRGRYECEPQTVTEVVEQRVLAPGMRAAGRHEARVRRTRSSSCRSRVMVSDLDNVGRTSRGPPDRASGMTERRPPTGSG